MGSRPVAERTGEAQCTCCKANQHIHHIQSLCRLTSNQGRLVKRSRESRVGLPAVDSQRLPWVEPGLAGALGRLSEQQRTVVLLLHAYDWTMSEVADALGVSKATVQTHEHRAMKRLRRGLKVDR